MLLRVVCCVAILGMFVPNAVAKTGDIPTPALYKSYPADVEVDAQLLFLDRVTFVKDMYELSNEDMEKVLGALQELVGRQEQYEASRSITLERLRIAVDLVAADKSLGDVTRARRVRTFQDQINRIHALAPLSLVNVMKAAEKVLTADQAAAGRKRVLALLVERTGEKPEAVDVTAVDALLAGLVAPGKPVEVQAPPPQVDDGSRLKSRPYGPSREVRADGEHSRADANRQLPPTKARPTKQSPEQIAPSQAPVIKPVVTTPAQRDRKKQKGSKSASVEPRVVEPAPPIGEWKAFLDQATVKYGFSGDQTRAAEHVVRGVMSRAARRAESAAAERDPDAQTENKKQLDRLYDEMKQRIDAIATIEQRQKVEGSETKPAAKPAADSEKKAAE